MWDYLNSIRIVWKCVLDYCEKVCETSTYEECEKMCETGENKREKVNDPYENDLNEMQWKL